MTNIHEADESEEPFFDPIQYAADAIRDIEDERVFMELLTHTNHPWIQAARMILDDPFFPYCLGPESYVIHKPCNTRQTRYSSPSSAARDVIACAYRDVSKAWYLKSLPRKIRDNVFFVRKQRLYVTDLISFYDVTEVVHECLPSHTPCR